jgi:hypothetical protein
MRKSILLVSLAGLAFFPAVAFADTVVVKPEVDTWVMTQEPGPGISLDADISIGGRLPDSVQVIDVPDYDDYSYVVVNKKRLVLDRRTRTIVKVYD